MEIWGDYNDTLGCYDKFNAPTAVAINKAILMPYAMPTTIV